MAADLHRPPPCPTSMTGAPAVLGLAGDAIGAAAGNPA